MSDVPTFSGRDIYEKMLSEKDRPKSKDSSDSSKEEENKGLDAERLLKRFKKGLTLGLVSDHEEDDKTRSKASRIGEAASEYGGLGIGSAALGFGIKKALPYLGFPGKIASSAIPVVEAAPGFFRRAKNFSTAAGGFNKVPGELYRRSATWLADKGVRGTAKVVKDKLSKVPEWVADTLGAKEVEALIKGSARPLSKIATTGAAIGSTSQVLKDELNMNSLGADLTAGVAVPSAIPATKMIARSVRDIFNPTGKVERQITRTLGDHLIKESMVDRIDPHTGEVAHEIDWKLYQDRLNRHKESPIEGYNPLVTEKLLPEQGQTPLPSLSQIYRMMKGNSPGLDQQVLENQGLLAQHLREAKKGDANASHFSEALENAWNQDKNAVSEAIENIRPTQPASIEDVGDVFTTAIQKAYENARSERAKIAKPFYDAAQTSEHMVPTTPVREMINELIREGVKHENVPILNNTSKILGKSAEAKLLSSSNSNDITKLFDSLSVAEKKNLAQKLGIKIPQTELTTRDYVLDKITDSLNVPTDSETAQQARQIYGTMQDDAIAKTAKDMGILYPSAEELASASAQHHEKSINSLFEDTKPFVDKIKNLEGQELSDVAKLAGQTDDEILAATLYARQKDLGKIHSDALSDLNHERARVASNLRDIIQEVLSKKDPSYINASNVFRENSGKVNAITQRKHLRNLLKEAEYGSGIAQHDPATVTNRFFSGDSSKRRMEDLQSVLGLQGKHQKTAQNYGRGHLLDEVVVPGEDAVVNLGKLDKWSKGHPGAHVNDRDLFYLIEDLANRQKNLQKKVGRNKMGQEDVYAQMDQDNVVSALMGNNKRHSITEELLGRVGKDTEGAEGFRNALVEEFEKKANLGVAEEGLFGKNFNKFFEANKRYAKKVLSPEQYKNLENVAKISRNANRASEMGNVQGSQTSTLEVLKKRLTNEEGRGVLGDVVQWGASKYPFANIFLKRASQNAAKKTSDIKRDFIQDILKDDKKVIKLMKDYNAMDKLGGLDKFYKDAKRNSSVSFLLKNLENEVRDKNKSFSYNHHTFEDKGDKDEKRK